MLLHHLLALSLTLSSRESHVQSRSMSWVGRLGRDTVMVESAVQRGDTIEGTVVLRAGPTTVSHYRAILDADERVTRFEFWSARPPAADSGGFARVPSTELTFGADSIRGVRRTARGIEPISVPGTIGSIPISTAFFQWPTALLELGIRAALRRDASRTLRLYYLGQSLVDVLPLRDDGGGYFSFGYMMERSVPMMRGVLLRVRWERDGLQLFDASETTFKIRSERTAWIDPAPLAVASVAADALQPRRTGVTLSPTQLDTFALAAGTVRVRYGRPTRRDRTIFPDVVPTGQVWRTGADGATHITFSQQVLLAGAAVPAGSYTLWTIPGERQDTLILNKQTGQWGVTYDAAQDLIRLPLRREMVNARREQLFIGVEPRGNAAGVLVIAWDDRRFLADLTVSPP